MPTPTKNILNMTKNMTQAQRAARALEEQALTREKVRLSPPEVMKSDKVAMKYWRSTLQRMKGITLLDDLDSEMLATYCQIMSRRDYLSGCWERVRDEDTLKRLESQERLMLAYAEKLGLTPSGRVRLAKRRAEEKDVDPDGDLYGDGT